MMLQWGVDQANSMMADAFVQASDEGARFFKRFGFESREAVHLQPEQSADEEEWSNLALKYEWMDRPKGTVSPFLGWVKKNE
jgi:predicted N-acetyltransferase YhbS